MSSLLGGSHAPLIILSNSIYARRSDGSYYPGSVEAKYEDIYTVKYADGATEQIREENLTWLGFWGLPPWCWPKSPVIQPVVSSWEAFESQAVFLRDTTRPPVARSEQFHEQSKILSDECAESNADERTSMEQNRLPSHSLPEQSFTRQTRSSVLRLNSNALTKDGNLDRCSSSYEMPRESVEEPISPTKQNVYREMQPTVLEDTVRTPSEPTYSQSTSPNDDFQRNRGLERPYDKPIYRYYFERRKLASERGIDREDDLRLEDTDYYGSDMYKSPYSEEHSPTINPTHFFNAPIPFFDQQLGMTLISASPHAVIPTSFRLQLKARRKDEKKKCRKVYGIENRHFWCTQCKWKKACTRFTNGSKIISNGFI